MEHMEVQMTGGNVVHVQYIGAMDGMYSSSCTWRCLRTAPGMTLRKEKVGCISGSISWQQGLTGSRVISLEKWRKSCC